jgi:nucleoside 2-deoxyribosyltransferase
MSKRVYVAGPWIHREDAKQLGAQLEELGYTITHKWWNYEGEIDPNVYGTDMAAFESSLRKEFLHTCAVQDVRGVRTADVVVVLNSAKSEGKAAEQGMAIILGLPIILITPGAKPSSNVFHYLQNYTEVKTIEEAIEALKNV